MSSDVRDILELAGQPQEALSAERIMSADNKQKKILKKEPPKRPEGMARELWGLISSEKGDHAPLVPTDTGYKQEKARIGRSRVRAWRWTGFKHPTRKDNLQLNHWRRVAEEGKKEYPFARFNKQVEVASYSEYEYQQHLEDDRWSRQETDHLMDLCRRFDLRFVIIHDRWDKENFTSRSVEDLKDRYYFISNTLAKMKPGGGSGKTLAYDAEHERRRKEQMEKLFNRTPEEVEEEQYLVAELKKIELRKKERERKTQDLQRLMHAVEQTSEGRRSDRKSAKKKLIGARRDSVAQEPTGIKFPEFKAPGATLRSQRMKMPGSVGQKKSKAVEQMLGKLGLETNPMPTEDMVDHFNELRQDLVLLYELKMALASRDYELQTLTHRYHTLAPGKMAPVGPLQSGTGDEEGISGSLTSAITSPERSQTRRVSETIDVVGGASNSPRKRRLAALEQANVMKRVKGHKS